LRACQGGKKADLIEIGRAKQLATLRQNAEVSVLSPGDKTVDPLPKVNTRQEIAKAAGVSTGQIGMVATFPEKGQKGFSNVLSPGDKTLDPLPKVNTQKEIAKAAGVSTGQIGMVAIQPRKKRRKRVDQHGPLNWCGPERIRKRRLLGSLESIAQRSTDC
jgi:DNA-directed RNA polymerase subunit H (RpoH/RPB5)